MSQFTEQVNEKLGQINALTTEIADDQRDLIAQLAANPTEEERAAILARLTAHSETLSAVASGYTPVPVPPGEIPGETPIPEPVDPPTDGGNGGGGGAGGGNP